MGHLSLDHSQSPNSHPKRGPHFWAPDTRLGASKDRPASPRPQETARTVSKITDLTFMSIWCVEMAIKIMAQGPRFFMYVPQFLTLVLVILSMVLAAGYALCPRAQRFACVAGDTREGLFSPPAF